MIVIGSDHAGYALKEKLKAHLTETGVPFVDVGTDSTASCHYPVFAKKVCEKIQSGECEKGILICGTGIGMSMAANKQKGIRAAVCGDCFSAKYTRLHNNANVLCLGARVVGEGLAEEITDLFLQTGFEGGKHQIRLDMFDN